MDKLKHQAIIAKLKATGLTGWLKRHLFFSSLCLVVLVLFLGSIIFTTTFYHDKSAPGVTVANTNIGGRTEKQIIDIINGLKKNMRISLTYGGKSATASADDLGINIKAKQIANQAVATGQGNPFAIIFNRQHFDLTGSYDKNKVQQFVKDNFSELTTEPIDSQINYDKKQQRYVVVPGAIGKSVLIDKLCQRVEKMLSQPGLSSYEIETSDDGPVINDSSAQETADQLNSVITKSRQITNNSRVIWTIDPWTITDWIDLTVDKAAHSYKISYNKSQISKFVSDSVASQISGKPVNQQAITDGLGNVLQVIRQGQNGRIASNADEVANNLYDSLVGNKGNQLDLLTKEAAYATDATVAADGHWIEAKLSNYEVKLWEGTNLAWSTDQTSIGKTGTATITGLYKVWHKNYEQCMPNPPSTQPLCNIHYVTYWESGYAFHEAWWMSQTNGNVRKGISHGCINMYVDDAKRVYDWSSIGTPVWVHW